MPTYFATDHGGLWIAKDAGREFGFVVRHRHHGKALEFQLFQTNGYDDQGSCLENLAGEILAIDQIDQAEVFLQGWIDIDGCMDFDHPEKAVSLHLCGLDAVKKMGECLQMLYALWGKTHE